MMRSPSTTQGEGALDDDFGDLSPSAAKGGGKKKNFMGSANDDDVRVD